MATVLKLILVPIILVAVVGWIAHAIVETFLDDLRGPDDGSGYA